MSPISRPPITRPSPAAFPRPFTGLHLQAIRQAPAPRDGHGACNGSRRRQGELSGRERPTWHPRPRARAAWPPGNFFPLSLSLLSLLSLSCSPPHFARPPLFLCEGDRISLRLPRAPGRPDRVRGQGPLRAPPAPGARCRPRSRLGSDRPFAEPGDGGGGGGGGGEGSWQPAVSRSEEGAPRPTLLPAWSTAAPDTHGRAGLRAAKSQHRTPGPGVKAGAEDLIWPSGTGRGEGESAPQQRQQEKRKTTRRAAPAPRDPGGARSS